MSLFAILDQRILEGLGIDVPQSTREWADRYRVVKGGPIADRNPSGRVAWRTSAVPHMGGIMDATDDPDIDTVATEGPTRCAKSEGTIINPTLKRLHEGRSVLYLNSTYQDCVKMYQDKLQPAIQASPVLARFELGSKDGGQALHRVYATGAVLYMAGAGQVPAGFDAAFVACDEVNKPGYRMKRGDEVSALHLARERSSGYRNRKLVMTCTVTTPEGEITRQYLAGDCRLYYVPCPFCGEYQVMEFAQGHTSVIDGKRYPDWDYPHGWLVYEDASPVTARASARYVCGLCQREISETHKRWMVSAGIWIRKGCRPQVIRKTAKLKLDPPRPGHPQPPILNRPFPESALPPRFIVVESGTPDRESTRATFHFNALISLVIPWGEICKEHVEAKAASEDEAMKSWQRSRLAIPSKGVMLDASELVEEQILDHMSHSKYLSGRQGRMPFSFNPQRVCVVGGIDIGKRRIHATADAWLVDERSCLVQSYRLWMAIPYEIPNPESPRGIYEALESLRQIYVDGWLDAEGKPFSVLAVAIDTGYQDTRKQKIRLVEGADYQVYEFCKAYGQKTWRAIKGANAPLDGLMATPIPQENTGIILWHIDTDLAKIEIHQQLRVAPGEPGYWHLPQDTPRLYARGLCAERRIIELDQHNNETARWDKKDAYNHPLDMEVYCWATARMLGVKPPRARVAPAAPEEKSKG